MFAVLELPSNASLARNVALNSRRWRLSGGQQAQDQG
jgi:hypothetical protein